MMHLRLLLVLVSIYTASGKPSNGQHLERIGKDGAFTIATWNIEWFGDREDGPEDTEIQFANVLYTIRNSAVDVWALQEIAAVNQFNRLLDSLGNGFGGHIEDNCMVFVRQRLAYVYNRDVIDPITVRQLYSRDDESGCHAFAQRPPLLLEAVTVLADTSLPIIFINVHMKALPDQASYERRADASHALKTLIDGRRNVGIWPHPVVILGDFNDHMNSSIRRGSSSPYENFMRDQQGYYPVTAAMEDKKWSFCGNTACTEGNPIIDHIIVTRDLLNYLTPEIADHFIQLTEAFQAYGETTSDHLPVYARFQPVSIPVSLDEIATRDIRIEAPHPNPFRNMTMVEYAVDRPVHLRIEAFDVLGRSVGLLMDGIALPGTHSAPFSAATIPPGTYIIRIETGEKVRHEPVVHVR